VADRRSAIPLDRGSEAETRKAKEKNPGPTMGFAALNPSYEEEAKNPDTKNEPGTKKTALFDIVKIGDAGNRTGGNAHGPGRGRALLREVGARRSVESARGGATHLSGGRPGGNPPRRPSRRPATR
jgi:hypothetical protein